MNKVASFPYELRLGLFPSTDSKITHLAPILYRTQGSEMVMNNQSLFLRNLQFCKREKDTYINNFNKMWRRYCRVLQSSAGELTGLIGGEKASRRKRYLHGDLSGLCRFAKRRGRWRVHCGEGWFTLERDVTRPHYDAHHSRHKVSLETVWYHLLLDWCGRWLQPGASEVFSQYIMRKLILQKQFLQGFQLFFLHDTREARHLA